MLSAQTLPMVFLKQVRDGRMPLYACYQAIQKADFVVTGYRGAGHLPGSYRVHIEELVSDPIRRDLGFAKDDPLTPVAAFWVDFDFTLSIAEEIWRARPASGPRISEQAVTGVKVAVLGGGVGAVTAAFELTDPKLGGKYDVTVYQMGWRLGGKGASGRNAAEHDRIEEHGLHIWFGFYENTFRAMRACYEALDRGAEVPIRTVDDAFHPAARFGVTESRLDRWTSWVNWFPENDKVPGTMAPGERPTPTVGHYLVQLLRLASRSSPATSATTATGCV